MFLIGITLTIGTSHVMSFFLARKKLRGTCTFFVGMGRRWRVGWRHGACTCAAYQPNSLFNSAQTFQPARASPGQGLKMFSGIIFSKHFQLIFKS